MILAVSVFNTPSYHFKTENLLFWQILRGHIYCVVVKAVFIVLRIHILDHPNINYAEVTRHDKSNITNSI